MPWKDPQIERLLSPKKTGENKMWPDLQKGTIRDKQEKRRQYDQRVREIEHATFTPLVLSTSGGMGRAATTFYKRLAAMLAEKKRCSLCSDLELDSVPTKLCTFESLNYVYQGSEVIPTPSSHWVSNRPSTCRRPPKLDKLLLYMPYFYFIFVFAIVHIHVYIFNHFF